MRDPTLARGGVFASGRERNHKYRSSGKRLAWKSWVSMPANWEGSPFVPTLQASASGPTTSSATLVLVVLVLLCFLGAKGKRRPAGGVLALELLALLALLWHDRLASNALLHLVHLALDLDEDEDEDNDAALVLIVVVVILFRVGVSPLPSPYTTPFTFTLFTMFTMTSLADFVAVGPNQITPTHPSSTSKRLCPLPPRALLSLSPSLSFSLFFLFGGSSLLFRFFFFSFLLSLLPLFSSSVFRVFSLLVDVHVTTGSYPYTGFST